MRGVLSHMAGFTAPVRRLLLKIQLVVREYTALSPATMRAITANTIRMSRLERRDRAVEASPARPVAAGQFLGGSELELDGHLVGATVAFERATLEVVVLADDLVRLSWGPDDEPVGWALVDDPDLPPPGDMVVEADEVCVSVTTPQLRVEVTREGVRVLDLDGGVRYHEVPPIRRGPARVLRRRLAPDEALCGLGEQAGDLDLRGSTIRLYNRDPGGAWGRGQNPLYCSIPVTMSRSGAATTLAFHDNPSDATMEIGAASDVGPVDVEVRFSSGMVRTYVAIGSPRTLLERYTGLTGRHPMPPRWALGYHQSRWGYGSSDELAALLDRFATDAIPISVLHLDIDYMDAFKVFSVDEERFDLPALSDAAAVHGARLVTIVDPAIRRDPGYDVYAEGIADGHFVTEEDGTVHEGTVWPGWAVFPDFTAERTRRWWASYYPRLLDRGVAGLWHDMNEPTSITLAGDRSLPRSARHDNDGRGGDHRECHNVYGMLMNEAGIDGLAKGLPGRRPFLVSRAGWAGMQRHAWNWTADVEATRAGLLQQVPTFLGLGLSGVGFTGSDIGGFSGVPSPEFFLRWLELGVLSPFCRVHSILGAPAREPWCWPEPAASQVAALIQLRYRLLPYVYTASRQAAVAGTPLLRPTWFDAPGESHDDADQMLLGDDLLCVITSQSEDVERRIELPTGDWWRWEMLPAISGGSTDDAALARGTVTLTARLGQPLVFARAGSIVPLDDGWRHGTRPAEGLRADHATALLALHVFVDSSGAATGQLFDDQGDGSGASRLDSFELADGVLRWSSLGDHPRPEQVVVVLHGHQVASASADGVELDGGQIAVEGDRTVLRLGAFAELVLSSPR